MAITIPTVAPLRVRFMERVTWTRTFSDYTSGENWQASVDLAGPEKGDGFTVDATSLDADAGEWQFVFETNDKAIGVFEWQIWATRAGQARTMLETGILEILPGSLDGARDRDSSTHLSRMLALIEGRLEGRLDLDSETYSVAGRSLSRIPMSDLVKMQAYYERRRRSELAALERGVTPGRRRRIAVRF